MLKLCINMIIILSKKVRIKLSAKMLLLQKTSKTLYRRKLLILIQSKTKKNISENSKARLLVYLKKIGKLRLIISLLDAQKMTKMNWFMIIGTCILAIMTLSSIKISTIRNHIFLKININLPFWSSQAKKLKNWCHFYLRLFKVYILWFWRKKYIFIKNGRKNTTV